MKRHKRIRVCADPKVQLGLAARIGVYWVICQGLMTLIILGMFTIQGESPIKSPWSLLLPALIISGLFLPAALLDFMIFSNRIVGPLFRLRNFAKSWAESETAQALHFRKGDFYSDIAENFNRICEKKKTQFGNCCTSVDSKATHPVFQMDLATSEFSHH